MPLYSYTLTTIINCLSVVVLTTILPTELDHRNICKVQFTGRSTYVLSLPKRWIEEMHLNAGDQVALIRELDISLSIVPFINGGLRESLNEVTAIVLPSDSSNMLKRKVVSMYLAGYDIIHLTLFNLRDIWHPC